MYLSSEVHLGGRVWMTNARTVNHCACVPVEYWPTSFQASPDIHLTL